MEPAAAEITPRLRLEGLRNARDRLAQRGARLAAFDSARLQHREVLGVCTVGAGAHTLEASVNGGANLRRP